MKISIRHIRKIIKEVLLREHLHKHPGKWEELMSRELPDMSYLLPLEREDIEYEFNEVKKMLDDNIVKMMNLSIDYPKMYNAEIRDDVDTLFYDQMNPLEKYEHLKSENAYGYEQLKELFVEVEAMIADSVNNPQT